MSIEKKDRKSGPWDLTIPRGVLWWDMNYMNYATGKTVINLKTVNVIEFKDGDFQRLRSYVDNPKGHQRAEQEFSRLLKEHAAHAGIVMDEEDVQATVKDGYWDDNTLGGTGTRSNFQLYLVHSL